MELRRLLLVDADPSALGLWERELSQRSWNVEVAATLAEARRLLALHDYDVLLVDPALPDGDGLMLVREAMAGAHPPRASLVMASGLDVQAAVCAARAGARQVLEKSISPQALAQRLEELLSPEEQLGGEEGGASCILGDTLPMRAVRQHIEIAASYPDVPVLVVGETGTGKELVARALHRESGCRGRLVTLHVAGIPPERFEAELFGQEANAHSAAPGGRSGLLEAAQEGTLFLDELGEMPGSLQPKLLQLLETRRFRRMGGRQDLPFHGRIVGATHRPVSSASSPLSRDLYYRLAGFIISLPALRERPEDVDELARHFLREFAAKYGAPQCELSEWALLGLRAHQWPGNVRELRSVIHQAAVAAAAASGAIGVAELDQALRSRRAALAPAAALADNANTSSSPSRPLREVERELILEAWACSGNNLSETARRLGLPRTTLRDKLRRFGVHGGSSES